MKGKVKIGVIEGDIASSIDAETVAKEGVPVVQINTGGECHLESFQIQNALNNLPLADIDLLLIENVGNLVCPAEFSIGEDLKVLVSSVPEGDDKVAKYPTLFQPADAIVLTKVDLLGVLDYERKRVYEDVSRINTRAPLMELSAKTGQGLEHWLTWLRQQREALDPSRPPG